MKPPTAIPTIAPVESVLEPDDGLFAFVVGSEAGLVPPPPPAGRLVPPEVVGIAKTEAGTTGEAFFSAQY